MSHSNPAPEFDEIDEVSASFCILNDLTQEDVPPAIVMDADIAGDEVKATIDFRTNVTLIVAAGRMLGPDPRGRHYFDRDGVHALEVQGESGSSKPAKIPLEVNDGDWGIGLFRSREKIPTDVPLTKILAQLNAEKGRGMTSIHCRGGSHEYGIEFGLGSRTGRW